MKQHIHIQIEQNGLEQEKKVQLWQLYQQYYLKSEAHFNHDIAESTYLATYSHALKIIGFTGFRLSHEIINQQPYILVYLNPMIIDSAFRGKSLITLTLAKLYILLWRDFWGKQVYIWINAFNYQSYLVLSKGMREVYPSKNHPLTQPIRQIIDHIGFSRYPDHYQTQQGTVNIRAMGNQLSSQTIPTKFKQDQDIDFFRQYNPAYQDGSSLITIAPLNKLNLKGLMLRYIKWQLGINSQSTGISPIRLSSKYPLNLAI